MDDPFSEYKDTNRQMWNIWTELHEKSPFYNVEGFRAGKLSLRPVEMQELAPEIKGKSLLHLMCHFGLDTLSWARLGAQVTGADISDEAIALASRLSTELQIPARFIATDVYHLPEALPSETFDIVFMSYGIMHWLPDLKRWAEIVSGFLKPGGIFYIVEDHPFMRVFDTDSAGQMHIGNPYFFHPEPFELEMQGSYASGGQDAPVSRGYQWDHALGEILNTLIDAGLRIEYLHEFTFAMRAKFPMMEQGPDGLWRLPEPLRDSVPMLFSLRARKG